MTEISNSANDLAVRYRYPGTQPFGEEQKDVFYGRDKDITALSDYISLHQVVVLYSKSGLGKTSLLKAGIIPAIENAKNYRPLLIRFKTHSVEKNETPLFITRSNIVKGKFETTWLDHLINNEPALWHDVKEQQIINNGKLSLLLIFDQFEELFDYPETAVSEFKEHLAEALFTKIPQRYRNALNNAPDSLSEEETTILFTELDIRVLFSIRADRLHLLNELSDFIPGILKNCYELQPLDKEGVEDAIYNPAFKKDATFFSQDFTFETPAVEKIISFLMFRDRPVESFQLQVICNSIERDVIKKGLKKVTANDLGNLDKKIENYYYDQLNTIDDEEDRLKSRKLIEGGFISETGQRRKTLLLEEITHKYAVNAALLAKLVDSRLVRPELLPDDGYAYELSHDSLIAPILKAKQQREQNEREEKLKKETAEANKKIQEAKRRQRKLVTLGTITAISALLAIVAFLWALSERNASEKKLAFAEMGIKTTSGVLLRKLNYSDAQIMVDDLIDIGAKSDITKETAFEIAYYFIHVSAHDSISHKSFEQLATLFSNEELRYRPQDDSNVTNAILDRKLRKLDSVLYEKMASRYFGKMVKVNKYEVSQTEVTVWQYNIFCNEVDKDISTTASNWGLLGDFPVVKVDWYDAIQYANWLSQKQGYERYYNIDTAREIKLKTGAVDKYSWNVTMNPQSNGYRLPFYAEWKMAASWHQSEENRFAGSDTLTEIGWFEDNSKKNGVFEPHPVGLLRPNFAELYDMCGNVWEWCNDEPSTIDCCPSLGLCKMTIGGAFNMPTEDCTIHSNNCGFKFATDLTDFNTIGFRLFRTVNQ